MGLPGKSDVGPSQSRTLARVLRPRVERKSSLGGEVPKSAKGVAEGRAHFFCAQRNTRTLGNSRYMSVTGGRGSEAGKVSSGLQAH